MGQKVVRDLPLSPVIPPIQPSDFVDGSWFDYTYLKISLPLTFSTTCLTNKGYGTERPMLDGPFNDVLRWNYYRIPEIIDHGNAFLIETEDQLEQALSATVNIYSKDMCILDVRLDIHDGSPALQRLTETLGKKVR